MLVPSVTPTLEWVWSSAWALLAVLVGYTVLSRARSWLLLRHIPGPSFAGLSKFWLLRKALGGRFHLDTAEVCEKYGLSLSLFDKVVREK
jgi:hypothetical protein